MTDSDTGAIWKALAEPTRRYILDLLRNGPRTTGTIAAAFPDLSRFAIMKHLRVLEDARLVLVRRKGRERWNYLNAVPLRDIYERWVSTLDNRWATSMLDIGRLALSEGQRKHDQRERHNSMTDTLALNHLSIEQELRIAADPETVFSVLTKRPDEWWGTTHRLTINRSNAEIRLDPRAGGVMGEYWDGDSFSLWGTVSMYVPNRRLEISGSCGMKGAVCGIFGFEIEQDGDGTVLKLSHEAIGTIGQEQQDGFDRGWNELVGNIKQIAEGMQNHSA